MTIRNISESFDTKKFTVAIIVFLFCTGVSPQSISKHELPVIIKNAWVRPAAEHANSAIYFSIENKSAKADTLLKVKSNAAEIVQIHESYKKDNDKMGMREVKFIAIQPKSKFEFKPGGFHVMLINLSCDVKIGSYLEATLVFKHAGKIKIKAAVQDVPGM